MDLLVVDKLTYSRGYHKLFSQLSFSLNKGDILRISGENGKGKTSLLRNIAGLSVFESGTITLANMTSDNRDYYQNCFYLGHTSAINLELNTLDNLLFLVNLKQYCSRVDAQYALDKIGLKHYHHELAQHMSAGQKRRIFLASLLLLNAPLWLLDEPFTALDKDGVSFIEDLIIEHCKNNGACIYTTHQTSILNNNINLVL